MGLSYTTVTPRASLQSDANKWFGVGVSHYFTNPLWGFVEDRLLLCTRTRSRWYIVGVSPLIYQSIVEMPLLPHNLHPFLELTQGTIVGYQTHNSEYTTIKQSIITIPASALYVLDMSHALHKNFVLNCQTNTFWFHNSTPVCSRHIIFFFFSAAAPWTSSTIEVLNRSSIPP